MGGPSGSTFFGFSKRTITAANANGISAPAGKSLSPQNTAASLTAPPDKIIVHSCCFA
jgi:hypothetical protein